MIKVIPLVENTTCSPEYRCKHGLCLYIETAKHKILFDLGMDSLFVENAQKMNVDIAEIDTVIISHGHKDHGGALKKFLAMNSKAQVYVRPKAFEPHYIKVAGIPFSVGLDRKLFSHPQIVFSGEKMEIDEELTLFSGVNPEAFFMKSNSVLFTKRNGSLIQDDFAHEQSLIISSKDGNVLISGCSHAGIVSIQNKAEELAGAEMNAVVGGFHLYNPPTKKYESVELIGAVAEALKEKGSIYYTCHCTGKKAYDRMKERLGEKLQYLAVGNSLDLYN